MVMTSRFAWGNKMVKNTTQKMTSITPHNSMSRMSRGRGSGSRCCHHHHHSISDDDDVVVVAEVITVSPFPFQSYNTYLRMRSLSHHGESGGVDIRSLAFLGGRRRCGGCMCIKRIDRIQISLYIYVCMYVCMYNVAVEREILECQLTDC
jgi:hypothetical protein